MKKGDLIAVAVAAAAVLAGAWLARRDFSRPNWRIVWDDMAFSPAYASQSENPLFANGRTEQIPPAGTIFRKAEPFPFGPGDEERERAGRQLRNPYPPSAKNLRRGRFVFENYCAVCHGHAGLGDGPVAARYSQLSFPAASAPVYEMPDGVLFHIIAYGNNNMPSHASQLSAADRWKVIRYLRVLQRRQMSSP